MYEQRTDMDSDAEPIVQAETPSSGAEEQVKQDKTQPIEAEQAEPMDDDDLVLQQLLDELSAEEVPESSEDSSSSDPEPVSETPAFDRDAVAKILKRDGVPDEIIRTATPETLSKWAEAASKRQKDVDSYGGRLKELEARLASAQPEAAVQANTPAVPQTPADPFAQMASVYGEDLVAPVRAAFVSQQQQMQEQMLLAQARAADSSLRVQYGAKAPSWDSVVAKMSELGAATPGGYASVDALAAAAYQAIVGSKPSTSVNPRANQPTAPKGGPAPVKPPPRDEDDDILDQIISGGGTRLRPATRK